MDAPPIQYVRTRDSYNIAFNVGGNGPTLLMMPYPFTHARFSWTAPGLCESSVSLAQRFRVVHFDARGQGLSSRGLRDSHRMEDYLLDMDAVAEALKLDNFVLFSSVAFWRAAVAYAASNPRRVSALILLNPSWNPPAAQPPTPDTQAGADWDTFLLMVGSTVSTVPSDTSARFVLRDRMRECIDPDDWRRMQAALHVSDPRPLLATISVPTLVLSQPGPWSSDGSEIAAAIPGAKLQLLEDYGNMLYSPTAEPPAGVTAIQEFLDSVAAPESSRSPSRAAAGLSARQAEVLGLIAEGRSNKEIAAALVLSLRTVERHVADLYTKLDIRNRAEATAFALNLPNRR